MSMYEMDESKKEEYSLVERKRSYFNPRNYVQQYWQKNGRASRVYLQ